MVKIAHAVQKIKNTQNYGISEATILDAAAMYRYDRSDRPMVQAETAASLDVV